MCWWRSRLARNVLHMMSEKVPPSRWLYPFLWYEEDRTRVPGVPVTVPRVFQQDRTRYQSILPRLYQTCQSIGYGYGCRTELIKVSGTDMDVVTNLPKCRVRVWMSYQAYERDKYGYKCFTKFSKRSGMVRLLVPVLVPDLGYLNRAVPNTRVFSSRSTELT